MEHILKFIKELIRRVHRLAMHSMVDRLDLMDSLLDFQIPTVHGSTLAQEHPVLLVDVWHPVCAASVERRVSNDFVVERLRQEEQVLLTEELVLLIQQPVLILVEQKFLVVIKLFL